MVLDDKLLSSLMGRRAGQGRQAPTVPQYYQIVSKQQNNIAQILHAY